MLAALGTAIYSQVGLFNIALEGQMLIDSFAAIVVNYLTGSVLLSVLAGIISGALIGVIVAVLQIKYKAADMVIGTSINLLVLGLTSILLFVILGVKGGLSSPSLISLKKINLPIKKMLEKGIKVGIGTDGAASNNNLNMLKEMNLVSMANKGIMHDPKRVIYKVNRIKNRILLEI